MSKPKGIFMGTQQLICSAYSEEVRNKLSESLDILPEFYDSEKFKEKSAVLSEIKEAEYAFSTWGMPTLSEKEIKKYLPKLKAVFYAAGTVQYFAKPYMNCGVKIFSAWGANAVPVAEVTVSEIILANKGFFQTLHRGGGEWSEHNCGAPHPGNYNTSVGLIGAGMIGSMVAERLKEYRLNIKVFDPFMSDKKAAALGVEKIESLPELFEKCHVISNHLADNPQTVNMIDRKCFDKMDSNGVFINTGRGQQVVENDLITALKEYPDRCAVLDVTYPEPPEKGSGLYTMPNVFLTPHMAGSIGNEIQRMGEYMLNEFTAFYNGLPTKYEVSEKMLETMA